MAQQSKLISVNKTLITVVMVFVLMAVFLSYYFKQEREIENTSLKNISNTFSSQLLLIRSQWFMENKPKTLRLKLMGELSGKLNDKTTNDAIDNELLLKESVKKISLNKNGWVDDISNSPNVCQKIWFMVMGTRLEFFKMPIGAVLINNNNKKFGHLCRYNVINGSYFSYHSQSGVIKVVYQQN